MTDKPSADGPLANSTDISALSRELQDIDQRLQALTAGEVDALIGPGGQSFLLQQAQTQLLRSEQEQRGLAQQLQNAHMKLLAAQEVAKIGSWSYDAASHNVEWSDEMRRIWNTDAHTSQVAYRDMLALIHPEDRGGFDRTFLGSLERGGQMILEHRLLLSAGAIKFVEERWRIERNEQGNAIRAIGTCQDITERRRVDEALRQSQAHLSIACRLGRIGAWSMDLSHSNVLWSDEVCAIHEVASGTSPSLPEAINFYAPEYRDTIARAARNCAELGAPFDLELEILTARGRRVWVRAMGEAVRNTSGAVQSIQGAFQDLSDRKQAELDTHRMAARLSTTLESLTVGFHATDRDWRFTYVNAEAERMLGRRREDLIGKTIWEALPAIVGTEFEHSYRTALAENRTTVIDSQFTPEAPWWRASAYPSEEGLAVYMRDRTIERAEQQQLKLLEASVARLNDMLIIVDATSARESEPIIQFVNDAFVRFTGYSRDEIIGKSRQMLSGPDTDKGEMERIKTDLRAFKPVRAELVNYKKSGEPYWVDIAIAPVAAHGTTYTHFVGVERDITERKRSAESLRRFNLELEQRVRVRTLQLTLAREDAEQAAHAKSTFLATMSHEIRTPMNGVLGLVEVLAQSSLEASQREMVQLIQDSADSLLNIIDDILDFSKIEAGKLRIESTPMRLTHTVEKVCGLLDPLASGRGVQLTMYVAPQIPETVSGDELRIRQILNNLVGNAIKFSSALEVPGRVSVRAELVDRQAHAVSVEFSISDNGVGMDEETLSQLFKPFSQADASTTRRFGGTGLGLAITDMLVRLMGGKISVQSSPGQGAVFRVRLPFQALPETGARAEVDAMVSGLQCRIIGTPSQLAQDLASYLSHAGAAVEQSHDLEHAAMQQSPNGNWLWLILPDQEVPSLPELRAMAARASPAETRFVLFSYGKRRQPRIVDVAEVCIDLNALSRRTLFRTLALAAGRLRDAAPPVEPKKLRDKSAAPATGALPSPQQRILIAEDNDTNRQVIKRQLQLLGYAAEITVDGREALQRWRSSDFALVLTDLRMPEMDGYALAAAIRAEETPGRHTAIVALTANALPEEAANCRAAGMDGYLVKPLRLPQLKAALEKWLAPVVGAPAPNPPQPAPHSVAPAVDLTVLKSQIGDDPSDIKAVLKSYGVSSERLCDELQRAIAAGLPAAAREAAHTLKSSALSIGAQVLGDLCAEIERLGSAGRADLLTKMWPEFQLQFGAVRDCLDSLEG